MPLYIPADDQVPPEQLELSNLDDCQAVVGGWIEPVDVPSLGITIGVNEEGLIRQLPLNPRATFLWWFHVPANRQKAILVGDALLAGMADHRGDSADVPDSVPAMHSRFALAD